MVGKDIFSKASLVIAVAIVVSCRTGSKETDDATPAKDTVAGQEIGNKASDTEKPESEAYMAHVIAKDGTKIAFDKSGSGPAVIIVGGALSARNLFQQEQRALVEKLSEHFTVYAYDRRGRGESTDVQPYAVEREIEDLESLINAVGGRAYMYGVSSGGALALQATARLGSTKVPKLAIFEPPYGQGKQAFDKQKQGVADLVKTGAPGEAAAFFMSSIGTPPEALEKMKSSAEWEKIKKIDFTLVYDYKVLGDGEIPSDVVKTISIPTLVMDGEKSLEFMHATADQIAKLLPACQRETLKGQMHQAKAEVVAPVLVEFFNGSLSAK
jgi:pimeloyl-ACP methyl ester carboxylesterase